MKKHFVTLLFLLAGMSCFANTTSIGSCTLANMGLAQDDATLLLENQISAEMESAGIARAGNDFGKCTIKIKMEIDGVEIEGELTIYDVNFIECALIKIGKFFSDLF